MYSSDLIDRVLNFYKKTLYSSRKIGEIFDISKSTINRWINKQANSQVIHKESFSSSSIFVRGTITKKGNIIKYIKNSLIRTPYQTLKELSEKIRSKFKLNLSRMTVCRYIHKINFTKKKIVKRYYWGKSKKVNINKFKEKINKFDTSKIICIDETYVNKTSYPNKAWGEKGKRLIKKYNAKIDKYSILMAITTKGIINYKIYKKQNIDTDKFVNFITELSSSYPNHYYLMDNVSFHKTKKLHHLTEQFIYIPPYHPELNPIEELFSVMKNDISKKIIKKTFDIDVQLKKFSKNVTDLSNFYKHSFQL